MKSKFKIGWQKYEDVLEQQFSNPLYDMILHQVGSSQNDKNVDEDVDDYEDLPENNENIAIPISKQLLADMNIVVNFDCWVGHTNFDITHETKNILDAIQGVEVLKIFSRYRFFIGVARMFKFKDVRASIEKSIIPKGEYDDKY